ncbi:MAG: hypothetical protein Q9214_005377 [Letrouitia sp. 1 TL-2023]
MPNPPPTPHQERLARGHHPIKGNPKGKAKADPSTQFAENKQIREWESRNQRDKMARMLGSWEILAWSGALRDEVGVPILLDVVHVSSILETCILATWRESLVILAVGGIRSTGYPFLRLFGEE